MKPVCEKCGHKYFHKVDNNVRYSDPMQYYVACNKCGQETYMETTVFDSMQPSNAEEVIEHWIDRTSDKDPSDNLVSPDIRASKIESTWYNGKEVDWDKITRKFVDDLKTKLSTMSHIERVEYYGGKFEFTPYIELINKIPTDYELIQNIDLQSMSVAEAEETFLKTVDEKYFPILGKKVNAPIELNEIDNMELQQLTLDRSGHYIRMFADFTLPIDDCMKLVMRGSRGKTNPMLVRDKLQKIYDIMKV